MGFVKAASPLRGTSNVSIYFGNGCYWGRQYIYVQEIEKRLLHREDSEITALGGYAGGLKTGENGRLCYHNLNNTDDYASLGHAEVVQVTVPIEVVPDAVKIYFDTFIELEQDVWSREDIFDRGPGYRAMIGIPGGMKGPLFSAVRAANIHNMTLQEGRGSDEDTFDLNKVWLMDSFEFPFHQAELCLQFHNNQTSTYPAAYHHIRDVLIANGRLHGTKCPKNYIC
ncbi:hypothetical protein CYMTET_38510 [Cymbomonas tetramitiformis]|uniref:Peptide-methionine (S)-S-oxide reductase n=1 Tax=Cymbomonas tetramitiformis TaxID=36881 RepID=A0AAE0CD57_9CHLO|nr:hypothetical protein CYMTET_38510 [Cymbomonas tetramitiformis]